ncbi:hypothetical protein [Desulfitobacterium chlororespirans]|uniref:Uncharacterized protein n=1 Tax=Desulfitobacterium chlororespirans DSM 11544 TaxID=1121395 RepID=A0A1M7SP62_9FIRM|nr:hypothetical protein [Desulfitobacterium chlororespirans]SHN60303.1 hypothetical protein SAMN02745215_01159 [Desulfitobacterium chlororespirans DSM 11544]
MLNIKLNQVMELFSENYNIQLHEAEEYFMAIVAVGLSLTKEMRRDITSIYNQNKDMFFENAKNFSGYDHILLSSGDLEQEVYAKKTLGILLSAEQSELIKVKVLRLIKKYYKDVYIYAQNNNYDGFRKKLSAIEDTSKNLKLTETLIVLYFYTMKQLNENLINLQVVENAFNTASLFININPINTDIQSELKRENRLAQVRQIVKDELGVIKKPSDILYSKNKDLKTVVSCLRNLLLIDKLDVDFIASKVNQDDLDKVMLAFIKTTGKSDFDKTQVIQSFGAGYIVKMLLNEYLKTRELYLSSNDEDARYSELKVLKEQLDNALSEKDTAEIQTQKLKDEFENYELKLKKALSEQSRFYEAQINELNKEIDSLKTNLDAEMKNREELFQLREFFIDLKNDDLSNDDLPTETSVDLSRFIANKKLLIIGGAPSWQKRLKAKFPTILTVDGFNDKIELRNYGEVDFVLFYSKYMSHKTYYKTVDFVRANDIPAGYIGKTNMDLVEFEIAEELNKRLVAH